MTEHVIPLWNRDGIAAAYTVVDPEDFDELSQYRWHLNTKGYAARSEYIGWQEDRGYHASLAIRMHRQVMGLPVGDRRQVDHRDRDKLNNRRSNLRVATAGENRQNLNLNKLNTSGYRGVIWLPTRKKWQARAYLQRRAHSLGNYATPEEAHRVVSAWRAEHMPFSEDAAA